MIVEPELRYRVDGARLALELGGEVGSLGPIEAFGLALAAIEVASRGPRGVCEQLSYWIESVASDVAHERRIQEVRK